MFCLKNRLLCEVALRLKMNSRVLTYTVIILLLFSCFDIAFSAKRRRRKPRAKKETTTTVTTEAPSSKTKTRTTPRSRRRTSRKRKTGRKKTGALSAADLLRSANLHLTDGDTTAALEEFTQVVKEFPDDTLSLSALASATDILLRRKDTSGAMKLVEGFTAVDSSVAPAVDLLKAKIYYSAGRTGYALVLARKVEVECAGTQWAGEAAKLAGEIRAKIKPIILPSGAEKPVENQPQSEPKGGEKFPQK